MSHSSEATPLPARPGPSGPSARLRKRVLPIGMAGALVLAAVGVHSAFATPSADALIAEVYGGGGNSGATYTNDFIELANAGGSATDLGAYSVQYLPGAPTATSNWQVTPLTGSLAGGGRYLVGESAGTGGSAALPTPDTTGTLALSGTSGTVALVSGADPLTCVSAAACAADSRVKDLVGYGTAVVHEGSGPAAGASNSASVARNAALTDTDDNAADFTAGAPTPQNSGGSGGPTPPPTTPPTTPPPLGRADPRHPGRHPGLALRRQGRHRGARHRDGPAHLRLVEGLLDPGPAPRQRPAHQRGHLRLHQLRPHRGGRRQRHRRRVRSPTTTRAAPPWAARRSPRSASRR